MKTYLLTLDAHGLISEPHCGKVLPTLKDLRKDLVADLELALGKEWALQVIRYEEVAEGLEQLTEGLSRRWPQATIVTLDRHLYCPPQAKEVVGVSRYSFPLGSDSESTEDGVLGQGPRPGAPTLEIQLGRLPKGGSIILIDGGSFSGEQLAFVANEVKKQGLKIPSVGVGILTGTAKKTLLKKCCLEAQAAYYFPQELDSIEWIEERDFWPGFGGRVLDNANAPNLQSVYQAGLPCQMPYILPFGDPVRWASLPKVRAVWFSKRQLSRTVKLFTALEEVVGELTFENVRKVLRGASFPYCERQGLAMQPSMRIVELLEQDLGTLA